jgi:hypothetical protein
MAQLILNVKQKNKLPFLKEILKRMEFVEIVEPANEKQTGKKEILKDIEDSVAFVKKHEKGKVKAKSFQQLINEL